MNAGPTGTTVSVLVCTHSQENYSNLSRAIASVLAQTHPVEEIVVVVDGNEPLYQKIQDDYRQNLLVKSLLLEINQGVCRARNAGIMASKGDIIAFLDDDAYAEKSWLEKLIQVYRDHNPVAVGGKVLPLWVETQPKYFPEELYWLVGVTHEGFAENKVCEVRNAFGPNMSFRREVFQKVGLFDPRFGFTRASQMQAEEPELALRIRHVLGKNTLYNPEAIVFHSVAPEKTRIKGLLKRSFYQGYSKACLNHFYPRPGAVAAESGYLRYLFSRSIPRRAARFYDTAELQQLALISASIISVGLGFMYGHLDFLGLRNSNGRNEKR